MNWVHPSDLSLGNLTFDIFTQKWYYECAGEMGSPVGTMKGEMRNEDGTDSF